MLLSYRDTWPKIDAEAFIAPGAVVVGDVEIGPETSIWYGCVLRGDVHVVRIGARTNIQDGSVVHVSGGGQGTHIGSDVTIGHMALLHDCTLQDGCFIGMRAVVMDGAMVETGAMVAAGALVPPGKRVPAGELWAGNPAKLMRPLRPEEPAWFLGQADHYVNLAKEHKAMADGIKAGG